MLKRFKIDSKSFKATSLALFFILPLALILAGLGLGYRLMTTWHSFAMVCSKTFDLLLGYIFHFENFWPILVIGIFSLALIKGLVYITGQIYKAHLLTRQFGQKTLFNKNGVNVVDDLQSFAVTVGFFNPQIYMSSALVGSLTDQELQAVISHEQYHQDNKHPLFLLVVNSLRSFLFFFPVLKNITGYISLKYEVLADQFSIDKTSKSILSLALLKIIDQGKNLNFPETVATFSVAKDRVNILIDDSNPVLRLSRFLSVVSVVMAILISLTVFSSPVDQVDASEIENGEVVASNSGQCHSPSESIISLVKFGQQSEANMTYDLELKMDVE